MNLQRQKRLIASLCLVGVATVAADCEEDYNLFLSSRLPFSDDPHFWAMKMSDAHASWPWDAVSEGLSRSPGGFYSCLEVEFEDFVGKHCMVHHYAVPRYLVGDEAQFQLDMELRILEMGNNMDGDDGKGLFEPFLPPFSNFTFSNPTIQRQLRGKTLGICVPSSCSFDEINSLILQPLMESSAESDLLYNKFFLAGCQAKDDETQMVAGDKIVIALFSLFALAILAATVMDIKEALRPSDAKDKGMGMQLLSSFSVYQNCAKLFDTSGSKRPELIPCLDGIRFWSMAWVVVLHTYDFASSSSLLSLINENEMYEKFLTPFLLRAIYNPVPSVDSFFVLGGCLLGYITFKEMDRKDGKINWLLFYLHRYIRITGVYAVVVAFFATLYKFFDIGLLPGADGIVAACQTNWWRSILYSSNILPDGEFPCLSQTWYLAAEMQMFILTPFLLYPMWALGKKFNPKASLAYWTIVLIGSLVTVLSLSIINGWTSNPLLKNDPGEFYLGDYYPVPWTRCSPYIIGIGLGFLLNLTKKTTVKINKFVVAALWIAAFSIGLAVTYGEDSIGYAREGTEPSEFANVMYNTFARPAWGVAISWLIFACFHGYGGFINTFLSWEAFGPLGKLAFNIYLVHYPLIRLYDAQITFPLVISHIFIVFLILFVFASCLFIAIFLAVCFEMPIISWDKIILGKIFKK